MCSLPAWICVGTETGMYQGNRRFIIQALKVREKCTKLSNQEHTFINNRTAAHRTYVSVVITLFKLTAGNIQFTVKCDAFFQIIRLFDKCLHNAWHALSCLMSKNLRNYRNFSPAKELQSLFFHNDLKHFFCLGTFDLMLWEKELANTIFSFLADFDFLFFTCFLKKFMGNLKEDTNAITCFAFCIFSGTMIQILYNPQCVGNCIMGFFAFDIDNCTDTAVIMFKFLTVKSLPFLYHFFHFPHPFYC